MNIPLGIDVESLKKDLGNAKNAIKHAGDEFAKAADDANGKAAKGANGVAKGFGSLQQQCHFGTLT